MTRRSLSSAAPVAALALALLCGAGARAAEAPDAAACRSDARSLCADVQPGGGRIVACLQQHEAQLTPACRAALPALASCSEQVRRVCGEPADREALRSCVREHQAQLGGACRGLGRQR